MSSIRMLSLTREELEEAYDHVKVVMMQSLMDEAMLRMTKEQVDEWCANHTIVIARKSLWRTISDKWRSIEDNADTYHIVVVKKV